VEYCEAQKHVTDLTKTRLLDGEYWEQANLCDNEISLELFLIHFF